LFEFIVKHWVWFNKTELDMLNNTEFDDWPSIFKINLNDLRRWKTSNKSNKSK
jgi:hypothetical protein